MLFRTYDLPNDEFSHVDQQFVHEFELYLVRIQNVQYRQQHLKLDQFHPKY